MNVTCSLHRFHHKCTNNKNTVPLPVAVAAESIFLPICRNVESIEWQKFNLFLGIRIFGLMMVMKSGTHLFHVGFGRSITCFAHVEMVPFLE